MEKNIQQNGPVMNENPPTVLVVEDDAGLNILIRKTLEREGIKSHPALNGAEAMAAAATVDYSLILLDYCLPDMTGKQIILALSKKEIHAPIIVMTGNGDERIAVEVMKLGVRDYIIKEPDFISKLPRNIHRVIAVITKEKELARAEELLRQSEDKFRSYIERAPDGVFIVDDSGRYIEANEAVCQMTGFSKEEIEKLSIRDLVAEESSEDGLAHFNKLMKTGAAISDLWHKHKDGSTRCLTINAVKLSETKVLGFAKDITKRKKAEQELTESKALFEAVVENVPLMIFLKEAANLRFVIFNRAGEELLGYDRKVLLGKNNLDLFPPEQAASFMAKDREVLDGEAGMLDIPEEPMLTAKKGARLLHTRKVCIRGADGTTKYLLGISEDITEGKQAEENRKQLEEQLRHSQKLEAIGQLSSGVAHDFNNLLGGIMGHAELLKMGLDPDSPLLHRAEGIISSCMKAADLTRQLLSFARKAPFDLQKVDLNAFLKQMVGLLDRTIDQRIEIVTDFQEQPAFISGDLNQLENAFLNIAINARDAMPEGGRLSIASETVDLGKNTLECECSDVAEGMYVKVSFRDTGAGMSKEVKDRIFEPFFTTKEVEKGTGLGLACVYGCVKQHNGHITVESEEGKGSTLAIFLPVIKTVGAIGHETAESELIHGKGTLLVIDDEIVYHAVLSEIFSGLGYTVHCCENGAEAVNIYRERGATIDVVILDLNMPRMNGLDCFRRLKEINPEVKVIVTSGYGNNSDLQAMQKKGLSGFVQKPFKTAELAKKIKELIVL